MGTASVWAVVMAGGSGTRFWPVSRSAFPKQLSRLLGSETMIQATVARLQPLIPPERVLVITTEAIAAETRSQLPMLPPEHIIAEPCRRDTAPCVALAAEILAAKDPDAVMLMLPADQVISPADKFQETLQAGIDAAQTGGLVTYGIQPRHPSSAYGYIQLGEPLADTTPAVNRVARFVEKPDADTAQAYLKTGDYRWNSGIFTWTVATVRAALQDHCPQLSAALQPVGAAFGSDAFDSVLAAAYEPLERISIDYALMENAKDIKVVTGDFEWDDVGSWDALYDHVDVGDSGMRQSGAVVAHACRNSLLFNQDGPLIAAAGLDGVTVVSTKDALLVVPRGDSQAVKQLVEALGIDHPDLI